MVKSRRSSLPLLTFTPRANNRKLTMTSTTEISLAPYEPIRAQIAELKAANANTVFKYEEPKGNKLARSHVASLRTVKGDIERKRKELKADALEYGRKVDAVAKELTGEIEAMIEVHDRPLREIEEREKARIAKHQENLAALTLAPGIDIPGDSAALGAKLARIKAIVVDDTWQEFKTQGLEAQAATCRAIEARLAVVLKQEAEAAELARLREAQAKAEAEIRAKLEAEARAKREEEIRAQAEAKAKREAADAAMAEARKKEAEAQAAINAEREKVRKAELAVAKAKQEKAEAEARVAREEQAKKDAEAKRAANAKHRQKVLSEIIDDLVNLDFGDDLGAVAEAMAGGKIRHVKVEF